MATGTTNDSLRATLRVAAEQLKRADGYIADVRAHLEVLDKLGQPTAALRAQLVSAEREAAQWRIVLKEYGLG